MTDCIFCKIIDGKIPTDFIYQDDDVVVFKDIRPKARVHLLVVAKTHIKSLFDVSPEQGPLIQNMLLLLPKLAKEQGLNSGFRTIINTGSGGGQEIDHIHFHLIGGGLLPGM